MCQAILGMKHFMTKLSFIVIGVFYIVFERNFSMIKINSAEQTNDFRLLKQFNYVGFKIICISNQ